MKSFALGIACAGLLAGCASRQTPLSQQQSPAVNPSATAAASIFAQSTANLDQLVVQSSQMALQRSQNPAARTLAQSLISSHTQLGGQLNALAQSLAIPVPQFGMTSQHSVLLSQLQSSASTDFDQAYQNAEVQALMQEIDLFQRYSVSGEIPELKDFAARALPILHGELSQAQSLPSHSPGYRRPPVRRSGERG